MDGEQSANLSPEQRKATEQECADVLLYLLRLADKLGIDLVRAGFDKLEVNRSKYPVEKSRGKSTKYTRL
jgi:NTP pyrophosphatase (non-canonical NTP hydrolase)